MRDALEHLQLQAHRSRGDATDEPQAQLPALPRITLEAAADRGAPTIGDRAASGELDDVEEDTDEVDEALDRSLFEGKDPDHDAYDVDADLRMILEELQERMRRDAFSERKLWDIEVARMCFKNWRSIGRSIRGAALRLIRRFMEGREERSRVNHAKPLEHAEDGLGLFESYMGDSNETRGYRLVWEEVWAWSSLYDCWRDKIVIWGVRDHDKVNRLVSYVSADFRRRKQLRSAGWPGPPPRPPVLGATRLPRLLPRAHARPEQPPAAVDLGYTLHLEALAPAAADLDLALKSKEKSRNSARADLPILKDVRKRAAELARSVLADREAEFAALPAQQNAIRTELAIICEEGPLAVSGRSGTGKTACAVARLWALYHAYWSKSLGTPAFPSGHLRAVYVTKSGRLLDKVRKDMSSLEPKHILLAPEHERGLEAEEDADHLIGSGEAELSKLASLADVADDMYPLFVSRRTWLRLLDGMLERPFFPRQNEEEEIDFDIFKECFWPRLSSLPKGEAPHPLLCWTEFLSLIAGSAESLLHPEGYASFEKYCEMGRTRSRMASDDQRRVVYDMYERYRALKLQDKTYKYDVTDVVQHIYRGMRDIDGFARSHLHELIADEASSRA
eukprot:tig00020675_g12643.t1